MRTDPKTLWDNFEKIGKKRYVLSAVIMIIIVFFIGDIKEIIFGKMTFGKNQIILKGIELIACTILAYIFSIATWNNIKRQAESQINKEENNRPKIAYCYYCGAELQDGEEVCSNCGKKLEV
ncbi:zinc-ribbon domain-containing protein [Clostridium manihotivorum]|uniref:Zinc-ribbon domain-containing protein n=1 Tax=Clostridium manihotivorum TaxID=2320868 RepID=A0A3R5VAK6_9CLOT|nr:zinc-ribbon domain-containing protein [Clostridium manihotivorum]QAA33986.1 hypothetical protein C1I91_21480 [Clostridium manihotivorum]